MALLCLSVYVFNTERSEGRLVDSKQTEYVKPTWTAPILGVRQAFTFCVHCPRRKVG